MADKSFVILLSGGMDSAVLLFKLLSEGHMVKTLGINYGQRHQKELHSAQSISEAAGVEFKIADLSSLQPLLQSSSLTNTSIAVAHGHYTEESMKSTVVPNRNMILLAVASGWAMNLKFDAVAYAAHGGDHAIYPDCREEFAAALDVAIQKADWHRVRLYRPFVDFTKSQICSLGAQLNVPFEKTWSCYQGGRIHCGKCGTCVERKEAFALAKVNDPTEYEIE